MDVASSGREGDEEELIPRQNPTSDCAIEQSCSDSEAGSDGKLNAGVGSSRKPPISMSLLIVSSILGNVLEWYDFGVFASFSTELSKAFFTGGQLEEILQVYGVFAVAFFARPLGGFLSGLIGDTYGRTLSLQISVVAMGASALVISVLPTNSLGSYSIGPAATLLLVGARIVQGLSTGGEMVGSMLYMVENVPPNRKCLVSSVPMCAAVVGTGCGYMVATIITATLDEEARASWGWRVAFALGVPAGLVGFVFRKYLPESEDFEQASRKFASRHNGQHPFFYAWQKPSTRRPLLVILTLSMAVCGFYSATTWYNEAWLGEFYTELIGERNISKLEGRSINTALLIVALGAGPALTAWVIDSLGSKVKLHACVALSGVLLALFTPPLLFLIARGNESIALVVAGQLAGIVLFTPCVATLALWLAREFPPVLQYTSLALSYNVAQCVFGGTVPYIATQIKANSDVEIAPAFYMSAIGAMGAAAVLLSRLKSVRRMSESLFRNMDA